MSLHPRVLVLNLSLLFLTFLLAPGYVCAQSPVLSKPVSLHADNQPLAVLLRSLGNQAGIKFSYDPDVINTRRKITINVSNRTLGEVLSLILDNPMLSFREIGDQLVIYYDRNKQLPPGTARQNTQQDTEAPRLIVLSPDTVFIPRTDTVTIVRNDTVIRYLTLVQRDTVTRYDTVYVGKTQKPGKPGERMDINNQHFNISGENNGFLFEAGYTQLLGGPSYRSAVATSGPLEILVREAEKNSAANFSAAAGVSYTFKRLGGSAGISYTRLGETFSYDYTKQVGGFYDSDTVETFYTVTGTDTTRYYITDSTYVPVDYRHYNYRNPNAYRYIEFPFAGHFHVIKNENLSLYLSGGLIPGFSTGSQALLIRSESDPDAGWVTSGELADFILSWQAGLGARVRLAEGLNISAEAGFRKQTTSLYSQYPVEKRFGFFTVKAGLSVKIF
jgi:hypothetical protein